VTGSYGVTFTPNAATVKNYEAITPTTKDIGVTVLKKGDLDGDDYLSSFDVLMVARVVMGYDAMPTGAAFALADVDGDTVITMADVLLLMRKAMGLI
ncbi:MAG: dockerin type I repeat-containing protein, partial [Clostridiales Family XIII bacterium]|nr:dockerin type I repeat-containing protein [Clostridiales Family XIII bacterium]